MKKVNTVGILWVHNYDTHGSYTQPPCIPAVDHVGGGMTLTYG